LYGIKQWLAAIAQAQNPAGAQDLPLASSGGRDPSYFLGVNDCPCSWGLHPVHVHERRRRRPGALACCRGGGPWRWRFVRPALLPLTFLKIGGFVRQRLVPPPSWLTWSSDMPADDQQLLTLLPSLITPGPCRQCHLHWLCPGRHSRCFARDPGHLSSFLHLRRPFEPPHPAYPLFGVGRRLPRWRERPALGLMAAVTWQLGQASLVDLLTIVVALAAFGLLLRFRINSTWLILAGALIGLAARIL
jgi:hypothetical protein